MRAGSGSWQKLKKHKQDVQKAARLALSLTPQEVEKNSMAMSPHNSLIFLEDELGRVAVQQYVAQVGLIVTWQSKPGHLGEGPCSLLHPIAL